MLFKLLFPTDNLCYCCKDVTPYLEGRLCIDCRDMLETLHRRFRIDDPAIGEIYGSVFYNSFVRNFVHDFKFNNKSYLYEPFAYIMHRTMILNDMGDFDIIIPVPIHWRKEAIRGYNQSLLLAQELSKRAGIPYDKKTLVKSRWTREQNRLSKFERESNLRDSFSVKDISKIIGKRILLVDDIFTTGNTMKACARVLMTSGAKSVAGLVFTTTNS